MYKKRPSQKLALTRFALATGLLRRRPHGLPGKLYLTLTSYPKRFPYLEKTLLSILSQSVRPDGIKLWIAHADLRDVPPAVQRLESRGVQIIGCEDYKSYKKIIHGLRAEPEAFWLTLDDDCHYPFRWIEGITSAWRAGESNVVCRRAHRILFDSEGKLRPYNHWSLMRPEAGVFDDYVFTGNGGVLYPPGALTRTQIHDNSFLELCPRADDLWLWWQVRRNGWLVRKVAGSNTPRNWDGSQETSLMSFNVGQGGNDLAIANLVDRYGLPQIKKPTTS